MVGLYSVGSLGGKGVEPRGCKLGRGWKYEGSIMAHAADNLTLGQNEDGFIGISQPKDYPYPYSEKHVTYQLAFPRTRVMPFLFTDTCQGGVLEQPLAYKV